LQRAGMVPVDFIYEGFLIRVRPNLDEFLEDVAEDFDVVIYTAAAKEIYAPMLSLLHDFVKDQLGRDDDDEMRLWTDCLFREDCTLKTIHSRKPFHHKDLTLFGCHLSRVVMVDNSPIVVSGQEPNIILIKDFFGKDEWDEEFTEVFSLLDTVKDIRGDIRYFLCDMEQYMEALNDEDQKALDLSTEASCKRVTGEFVKAFKKDFKQNQGRRGSISMSQSTRRQSLSKSKNNASSPESKENGSPVHIHANTVEIAPSLIQHQSSPMLQSKKQVLKQQWKGRRQRHKTLLSVPVTSAIRTKQHVRYSSMAPKIEDKENFDIAALEDDVAMTDIRESEAENQMELDAIFAFRTLEDKGGDITDYEEDGDDEGGYENEEDSDHQDEYMLINSSPIAKPKKKRMEVKFKNMTSEEIREVHEEYDDKLRQRQGEGNLSVPLRIEFATVDMDDEENANHEKHATTIITGWNAADEQNNATKPLLSGNDGDDGKNRGQQRKTRAQIEKEQEGCCWFGPFKFFCLT